MGGPLCTIEAQAKINLALRIQRRDSNGYHPLETLFLRLELADLLSVEISTDERSIICAADLGPAEDNLAFAAASAFARETGWPEGWVIRLEKHIPMGAGLGGGSADAGAVLRCLNRMAPTPLSAERVIALGSSLGADVPFMASEYAFAFGSGYGERLQRMEAPEQRRVALLVPHFAIETAAAYAWFDEQAEIRTNRAKWDLTNVGWANLGPLVENDLQAVVAVHHPEIVQAVELLSSAGARVAAMTGSGSVVFGIFPVGREPEKISVPPGWNLIWTQTAASVVQPQPMG